MVKKGARSRANIIAILDDDFVDLKILSYEETYTFDDNSIEALNSFGTFPADTVFKPFDVRIQPYFISSIWVCFPEYPFTLGLSYPFFGIIC